jgi:glycosyltransferase involved in cell wall biosynthesis
MSLPVSVLLLARDEAARLDRLLPRLSFAREAVVVVDAASRDETRAVAARHGVRVFERALDGFGAQRAFALAQAREPWVLWIDADEWPDERLIAAIGDAIAGGESGFRVLRRTWFLGRPIRYCGWQGERILRLFRREHARFDDALVHEQVRVDGAIGTLEGTLEHHSYAAWGDCRDKLFRYAAAGAETARRAGRSASVLDLIARPPLRFLRMYVLQLGVLDGARGLAVCLLAAAQVFLKYAELWSGRVATRADAPPER